MYEADPTLVFHNDKGYPVYRVTDPKTRKSHLIVVLSEDVAYWADSKGRPSRPERPAIGTGAILGGLIGLLGGTAGAVIGAGLGSIGGFMYDNIYGKGSSQNSGGIET